MEKRGVKDIPRICRFLIILIVVIVVICGGYTFYLAKTPGKELIIKNQTNEPLPIAPLPENRDYTYGEIVSKGASEGPVFCNTLKKENLKKVCIESYIFNRAKQGLDASICKESKDSIFIRNCQYRAIVVAVAKKYCEESKAQNNTDILPSNIELCKQVDNPEDKAGCYNPKQIVDSSDVGVIYYGRKCEGYINLY